MRENARRDDSVSPATIRMQLDEVLESSIFSGSTRPSALLRFLVEHGLSNGAVGVTEWDIAAEVFSKRESFDPRIDPIVRVEVRRLRKKLTRYYETQGASDPILITIPARSYAPAFRARLPATAAFDKSPRSVAVVAFASLSGDPENQYFCDGLTETLIRGLSGCERLRVAAWSARVMPGGWSPLVRELGRECGVQAVLTGGAQREAGRIRVSAQLVRAADGLCLWSDIYERDLGNVFAIQEELAKTITAAVQRPGVRT